MFYDIEKADTKVPPYVYLDIDDGGSFVFWLNGKVINVEDLVKDPDEFTVTSPTLIKSEVRVTSDLCDEDTLSSLLARLRKPDLPPPPGIQYLVLSCGCENHPVSIQDLYDVLVNLPHLRRLDINGLVIKLPSSHMVSAPTKRFRLDYFKIGLYDFAFEFYPFIVAGLLHLFDRIGCLVLSDWDALLTEMPQASDPSLDEKALVFPSSLRVDQLQLIGCYSPAIYTRIAASPICLHLSSLWLGIYRRSQLPAARNLLRACTALLSVTLELRNLDRDLSGIIPSYEGRPVGEFLDLSSCKTLRELTLNTPSIPEYNSFDPPGIVARVISSLPSTICSVSMESGVEPFGHDIILHGMNPIWSSMDLALGQLKDLEKILFRIYVVGPRDSISELRSKLSDMLNISCTNCDVECKEETLEGLWQIDTLAVTLHKS